MITNHDVHLGTAEELSVQAIYYSPTSTRHDPFASVTIDWDSNNRTSLFFDGIKQAEAFSAKVAEAVAKLRKDQDAIALPPVQ